MFEVRYHPDAVREMERLRAFDRARILNAIGKFLVTGPMELGRNIKRIALPGGGFVYQLRVGDYRVFYDVDAGVRVALIEHVRHKGRKTTGEIL